MGKNKIGEWSKYLENAQVEIVLEYFPTNQILIPAIVGFSQKREFIETQKFAL